MTGSARVSNDTLGAFLAGSVEENLQTIPGVGPANEAKLVEAGILTTQQLLGKFLMLYSPGISVQDHLDAFFNFLSEIGISAYRAAITRAIAEKVNSWMPGTFDETAVAE